MNNGIGGTDMRDDERSFVELGDARVARHSPRAVLLDYEEHDTRRWTPISLLSDECRGRVEEAQVGDVVGVEVEDWWARREFEVEG